VELAAFVTLWPSEMVLGLTGAELPEILGSLGHDIAEELELDAAKRFTCSSSVLKFLRAVISSKGDQVSRQCPQHRCERGLWSRERVTRWRQCSEAEQEFSLTSQSDIKEDCTKRVSTDHVLAGLTHDSPTGLPESGSLVGGMVLDGGLICRQKSRLYGTSRQ
jgi:hypothetical protein